MVRISVLVQASFTCILTLLVTRGTKVNGQLIINDPYGTTNTLSRAARIVVPSSTVTQIHAVANSCIAGVHEKSGIKLDQGNASMIIAGHLAGFPTNVIGTILRNNGFHSTENREVKVKTWHVSIAHVCLASAGFTDIHQFDHKAPRPPARFSHLTTEGVQRAAAACMNGFVKGRLMTMDEANAIMIVANHMAGASIHDIAAMLKHNGFRSNGHDNMHIPSPDWHADMVHSCLHHTGFANMERYEIN